MAFRFGSERSIGRGEVAESQIEAPFFAAFMTLCAVGLFIFHVNVGVPAYTFALAASMLVFGVTVIRVEYGIIILVLAMLLSPEIQAGAVGAHNERTVNLRYDDILIIVIFLGVLAKLAYEGRFTLWQPNPINAGIAAYFSVCLLSSMKALYIGVAAWDPSVAFFEMLKMAEFYMVFFMVTLAVNNLSQVRRHLRVFFVVSFIVCAYAISTIGTLDRVSAPFDSGGTEPNTLGGYLIVIICATVGLGLYAPMKRWRYGFFAFAVVAFVPFIMTLSRASYLALIASMAAIAVMGRRWSVVALVAAVLLASPMIMPAEVKERVLLTLEPPSGQEIVVAGRETNVHVDTSTYERIYVWKKVRFNLGVWPWLGGGVSWETVVDSQYARVLIETGVLGMAAFAFLFYRILRTMREAHRWSRDWVAKGLSLGVSAAFVGLIVHGLGTITFLIVRIMEPFWFLVALAVVAREVALADYERRVLEYRRANAPTAPGAEPALAQPAHA